MVFLTIHLELGDGFVMQNICSALRTRQLIQDEWLKKPCFTIEVKLGNQAPILKIHLHDYETSSIVDTGSSFTLVPHDIWQALKINSNRLDSTTQYNINSASHCNRDAVLGKISLNIKIKTCKGLEQTIEQDCLILRPNLELSFVLLGNDFLKNNSVSISYSPSNSQPILEINSERIPLLTDTNITPSSNFVNAFLTNSQQINPAENPSATVPTSLERENIPASVSEQKLN